MQEEPNNYASGFTIIELILVIVVIGILSSMLVVSYTGVQSRAYDISVLSDLDVLDSMEAKYSLSNGAALEYYSGTGGGEDSNLEFKPSDGNVIDVVVSGIDYCIRGYNIKGLKNTIYNAQIKESTDGICSSLTASAAAIADSPGA